MPTVDWPDGFVVFGDLHDPRLDRPLRHPLAEIVVIAIAATDSWAQVAQWGRTKEGWLRTFLPLPFGVPTHDTFGRVFALLDPQQFAA